MTTLDSLFALEPPRAFPAIPEFAPVETPVKPSRGFRPVTRVFDARFSDSPLRGIRNPGTATAAQRAGKRYEKKVLQALEKQFRVDDSVTLRPSPWIAFSGAPSEERHCQPDLLLVTESEVLLCEIKLSHTLDAYWQLERLYRPVVEKLFGARPVRLVEITRSFDPAVRFPAPMRLFFSIEHILRTPRTSAIEVLQWKL